MRPLFARASAGNACGKPLYRVLCIEIGERRACAFHSLSLPFFDLRSWLRGDSRENNVSRHDLTGLAIVVSFQAIADEISSFAEPDVKATAIHVVKGADFRKNASAFVSPKQAAWLQSVGWTAKPGTHALLPGTSGLGEVVLGKAMSPPWLL